MKQLSEDIATAEETQPPGSPDVQNLKEQRRKMLAKLKSTRDFNVAALQKRVSDKTQEFYNLAVKKIQDYAKAANYDLILKSSDDKLEADDQATLKLKISYRTVVWFQAANDITDAVLADLNK